MKTLLFSIIFLFLLVGSIFAAGFIGSGFFRVAPTLTASGLDVLVFTSIDGGATVYGFMVGSDMR